VRAKATYSTATSDARQLSFELIGGAQTSYSQVDSLEPEVVASVYAPATGAEVGRNSNTPAPSAVVNERAYPHMYDPEAGQSGAAMSLIGRAKTEAAAALDAWGESNLDEVSSRLSLVATNVAAAHRYTAFNESLGAVVSYVRRAVLCAAVPDLETQQLMLLARSLVSLHQQPMVSLDEATDMIEELENAGWRGRHSDVAAFVAALVLPEKSSESSSAGGVLI
jgi:hypothetical protein